MRSRAEQSSVRHLPIIPFSGLSPFGHPLPASSAYIRRPCSHSVIIHIAPTSLPLAFCYKASLKSCFFLYPISPHNTQPTTLPTTQFIIQTCPTPAANLSPTRPALPSSPTPKRAPWSRPVTSSKESPTTPPPPCSPTARSPPPRKWATLPPTTLAATVTPSSTRPRTLSAWETSKSKFHHDLGHFCTLPFQVALLCSVSSKL